MDRKVYKVYARIIQEIEGEDLQKSYRIFDKILMKSYDHNLVKTFLSNLKKYYNGKENYLNYYEFDSSVINDMLDNPENIDITFGYCREK